MGHAPSIPRLRRTPRFTVSSPCFAQLSGYASAILHPLMRVLDGPYDELRLDALETICALALALGPDFAIFTASIHKARGRVFGTVNHNVLQPYI